MCQLPLKRSIASCVSPVLTRFTGTVEVTSYRGLLSVTSIYISINVTQMNNFFNQAYITGFTDGEGSFGIYFQKNSKFQLGYQVKYEFTIALHKKDQALLEMIKLSFNGVGGVHKHGKLSVHYRVSSIKDISIILDHFDKHPLITQKRADYELFKQAFELIERKEHLTLEGFREILSIKASMNLGLSDSLKEAFPGIVPVERPQVEHQVIADPS